MTTMQDFVSSEGVAMTFTRVDRNPHAEPSDWDHAADHYRCTLRAHGKRMVVYFTKGSDHHGEPPHAAEVLECLASDAAGVENARDFADWCSEYGYDTDSRKAHKTYKTIQRQTQSLKRLFEHPFNNSYETLLFGLSETVAA